MTDAKTGEVRVRTHYKSRIRTPQGQRTKNGFKTLTAARAYEAKELEKIRTSSWTDPSAARTKVQNVFEDWIEAKQISNRTRFDYREVWTACIAPTWANIPLKDVSPSGINRWISDLTNRYSPARVKKAGTVYNQVLNWAVADQLIPTNPMQRAQQLSKGSFYPKPGVKAEIFFLSKDQVRALANAIEQHSLMILVLAFTGVRFGEITALQVKDIDLLGKRINVQRAWSDVGGHLEEAPPKSGKARSIPLTQELTGLLGKHLATLERPTSLVFTGQKGGPLTHGVWNRRFLGPAKKRLGLTDLTTHGLRHTYAVLSIQAGVNAKVLQQAMGHSNIHMTLDTYGGFFESDLDALGERLGEATREDLSVSDGSFLVPVARIGSP